MRKDFFSPPSFHPRGVCAFERQASPVTGPHARANFRGRHRAESTTTSVSEALILPTPLVNVLSLVKRVAPEAFAPPGSYNSGTLPLSLSAAARLPDTILWSRRVFQERQDSRTSRCDSRANYLCKLYYASREQRRPRRPTRIGGR